MRRRTTSPSEATDTESTTPSASSDAESAAGAPRQRRPRQKSGTGRTGTGRGRRAATSETSRLIEALLKSRGAKGAFQADLEHVIRWSEVIHAEGSSIDAEATELRKLGPKGKRTTTGLAATRQRQQRLEKQRVLDGRRQRHAMNQALVAGVLEGSIALDVQPGGQILFLEKTAQEQHATLASTGLDETESLLP